MTEIRLFSYKLTNDSGFAPNPFWGSLTLATCKPSMRKSKAIGDWIAGFTSQGLCGDRIGDERLVYLMQIDEKLTIADYFRDGRFAAKIPSPSAKHQVARAGDNIYRPLRVDPRSWVDFAQLPNPHHWDGANGCGGHESRERDVSGWFVLISKQFAYFGRNAVHIPPELRPEVPRGQSSHGSRTYNGDRTQAFVDYVFESAGDQQVVGPPHAWPAGDESWRTTG